MKCPSCGKQLKLESMDGRAVERCETCAGMWLSVAEFGQLIRKADLNSGSAKPLSHAIQVNCPKCQRPLVSFNYAYDSGIFINRCHECDGVWLLAGQLERIASHRVGSPAMQRLGQALGEEIRAENRWRGARMWLRSRVLAASVAVFYLLTAVLTGGFHSLLQAALFLVWPLACIWFPDGMGNLVGISLGHVRPVVTQQTPGDLVAVGGWIVLLSPLVVLAFLL
ncbi:MAG: zf-TFIIB domain-containing protein [Planctomycetaceae bacterium]|nr:zf-TFIIB domain-containing protein [Planctomycetaceae bacterium]